VNIPLTVSSTLPLTLSHEVELTTELVDSLFTTFKSQFNKVYDSDEEHAMRRNHFEASLKRIQEKNSVLGSSPNFGVTKFSDMSPAEFKQKMLNYKPSVAHDDISRINAETHSAVSRKLRGKKAFAATASDKDWRDDGAVTAVKDQGQCGSCWAFSTTEGIESAFFLSGYELTELSVEQLVQCDTEDAGCNGGDTIAAYDYIQEAEGLATESDYPYTSGRGVTGKCNDNFSVVEGTNVASWKYATPACTTRKCEDQDEDTLAATLHDVAPPSICVNAESWQDYTTGVLKGSSCGGNGYYSLDHCVQLIGYSGISGNNGYWIVRNSWADDWGVDGMIHLEYGANTCGVADEATVVTLK
jgi:C1A family cysteine protease